VNDTKWNEQIRQHNTNVIAEAQRIHELKQTALQQVIEANRTLVNAFRDEGELRDMPEDLMAITSQLGKVIRELDTKEQVELLGQDVEEFRVELPAWTQAK